MEVIRFFFNRRPVQSGPGKSSVECQLDVNERENNGYVQSEDHPASSSEHAESTSGNVDVICRKCTRKDTVICKQCTGRDVFSREDNEGEDLLMKKKRKSEVLEPDKANVTKKMRRHVSNYVEMEDQFDVDEARVFSEQRIVCENEGFGKENVNDIENGIGKRKVFIDGQTEMSENVPPLKVWNPSFANEGFRKDDVNDIENGIEKRKPSIAGQTAMYGNLPALKLWNPCLVTYEEAHGYGDVRYTKGVSASQTFLGTSVGASLTSLKTSPSIAKKSSRLALSKSVKQTSVKKVVSAGKTGKTMSAVKKVVSAAVGVPLADKVGVSSSCQREDVLHYPESVLVNGDSSRDFDLSAATMSRCPKGNMPATMSSCDKGNMLYGEFELSSQIPGTGDVSRENVVSSSTITESKIASASEGRSDRAHFEKVKIVGSSSDVKCTADSQAKCNKASMMKTEVSKLVSKTNVEGKAVVGSSEGTKSNIAGLKNTDVSKHIPKTRVASSCSDGQNIGGLKKTDVYKHIPKTSVASSCSDGQPVAERSNIDAKGKLQKPVVRKSTPVSKGMLKNAEVKTKAAAKNIAPFSKGMVENAEFETNTAAKNIAPLSKGMVKNTECETKAAAKNIAGLMKPDVYKPLPKTNVASSWNDGKLVLGSSEGQAETSHNDGETVESSEGKANSNIAGLMKTDVSKPLPKTIVASSCNDGKAVAERSNSDVKGQVPKVVRKSTPVSKGMLKNPDLETKAAAEKCKVVPSQSTADSQSRSNSQGMSKSTPDGQSRSNSQSMSNIDMKGKVKQQVGVKGIKFVQVQRKSVKKDGAQEMQKGNGDLEVRKRKISVKVRRKSLNEAGARDLLSDSETVHEYRGAHTVDYEVNEKEEEVDYEQVTAKGNVEVNEKEEEEVDKNGKFSQVRDVNDQTDDQTDEQVKEKTDEEAEFVVPLDRNISSNESGHQVEQEVVSEEFERVAEDFEPVVIIISSDESGHEFDEELVSEEVQRIAGKSNSAASSSVKKNISNYESTQEVNKEVEGIDEGELLVSKAIYQKVSKSDASKSGQSKSAASTSVESTEVANGTELLKTRGRGKKRGLPPTRVQPARAVKRIEFASHVESTSQKDSENEESDEPVCKKPKMRGKGEPSARVQLKRGVLKESSEPAASETITGGKGKATVGLQVKNRGQCSSSVMSSDEMTGKVMEAGSRKGTSGKKVCSSSTQESIKSKKGNPSTLQKSVQSQSVPQSGVSPKNPGRYGRKSLPFVRERKSGSYSNKRRDMSKEQEKAVPSGSRGADCSTSSVGGSMLNVGEAENMEMPNVQEAENGKEEAISVETGGVGPISVADSSSNSTSEIDEDFARSETVQNVHGPGRFKKLTDSTAFVVVASVASTLVMCGSLVMINTVYPEIAEQVLKWFPQRAGQVLNWFPQLSHQMLNWFNQ